jgi:hypothetical protein
VSPEEIARLKAKWAETKGAGAPAIEAIVGAGLVLGQRLVEIVKLWTRP